MTEDAKAVEERIAKLEREHAELKEKVEKMAINLRRLFQPDAATGGQAPAQEPRKPD